MYGQAQDPNQQWPQQQQWQPPGNPQLQGAEDADGLWQGVGLDGAYQDKIASGVALGVEEAGWLVEAGFALDTEYKDALTEIEDLLDRAKWPRWCKLL